MFCPKCGAQNPDNGRFCCNCQAELNFFVPTQQPAPEYIPQQPVPEYVPTPTPEYIPAAAPVYAPAPAPAPKKSNGVKIAVIVALTVLVALAAVFAVLISTHVICIEHEYKKATCTQAKTCKHCGKEDGEAKGHVWIDATCTEAKYCEICDETEGSALGHQESDWQVVQEATLVSEGSEEKVCTLCDIVLDTRDTDVKIPMATGREFNFTADEFVAWVEDNSAMTAEPYDSNDENSMYIFSSGSGNMVGVMLVHGDNGANGNIKMITAYSTDNNATAIAFIALIGELIDSKFNSDSAMLDLYYYRFYETDTLTAMLYVPDGADECVVMTTTDFFAEDNLEI